MSQISEQTATGFQAYQGPPLKLPIQRLRGANVNDYQRKVETTYEGDPEDWRKAIGNYLLFQFGIYDHPDSKPPISLDESGIRYFE